MKKHILLFLSLFTLAISITKGQNDSILIVDAKLISKKDVSILYSRHYVNKEYSFLNNVDTLIIHYRVGLSIGTLGENWCELKVGSDLVDIEDRLFEIVEIFPCNSRKLRR